MVYNGGPCVDFDRRAQVNIGLNYFFASVFFHFSFCKKHTHSTRIQSIRGWLQCIAFDTALVKQPSQISLSFNFHPALRLVIFLQKMSFRFFWRTKMIPKGNYLVQWQWRGYYDVVDVKVVDATADTNPIYPPPPPLQPGGLPCRYKVTNTFDRFDVWRLCISISQ